MSNLTKICSTALLCVMLQGCIGTVVGAAVDVAIEVVKVPFKVGAAVIDVVDGDGTQKKASDNNSAGSDSDGQ